MYSDELPSGSLIRVQREAAYAAGEIDIDSLRKSLKNPKLAQASRHLFQWFVTDYERWLERQAPKQTAQKLA